MINFRTHKFNPVIDDLIYRIHTDCFHKHEAFGLLNELYSAFDEYYYSDDPDYIIKVDEVFSQFLNDIFYFVCKNITSWHRQKTIFSTLLQRYSDRIFFKSTEIPGQSSIVFYTNPETGTTLLHSLCRSNQLDILKNILSIAKNIWHDDILSYLNFILHKDKFGFDAIHSACKEGHYEIVEFWLKEFQALEKAILDAGLPGRPLLKEVLTSTCNEGFSLLSCAVKEHHTKICKLLLDTAHGVFLNHNPIASLIPLHKSGGDKFKTIDLEGYKKFLTSRNLGGFTIFHNCCKEGNEAIIEMLLSEIQAVVAILDKKTGSPSRILAALLLEEDEVGFTPITSIATAKHVSLFTKLFNAVKNAFLGDVGSQSEEKTKGAPKTGLAQKPDVNGYKRFLTNRNKHEISLFKAIINSGCMPIIQLYWSEVLNVFKDEPEVLENLLTESDRHDFNPLKAAAHDRNIEVVKFILNESGKLFSVKNIHKFQEQFFQIDTSRFTFLNDACKNADFEMVALLLPTIKELLGIRNPKYLQLLNYGNKDGYAPLNSASTSGNFKIVELLFSEMEQATAHLSKDQQRSELIKFIEHRDNFGFSSLNTAAKAGHIHIIRFLLKKAEQYYKDDPTGFENFITEYNLERYSTLNSASRAGHLDIVHLSLQVGQKTFTTDDEKFFSFITNQNRYGFSPLLTACTDNFPRIVELLLQTNETSFEKNVIMREKFLTLEDVYGFSALNTVIKRKNIEIFRLVLDSGKRIFLGKPTAFETSTHREVKEPIYQKENLKKFEDFITRSTKKGYTTLNSACSENAYEIVKLLLETWKAVFKDKNQRALQVLFTKPNYDGFTPLLAASKSGNTKLVELLLKEAEPLFGGRSSPLFKQFLNAQNKHGFTALSGAQKLKHQAIVSLLTSYGAQPKKYYAPRSKEYYDRSAKPKEYYDPRSKPTGRYDGARVKSKEFYDARHKPKQYSRDVEQAPQVSSFTLFAPPPLAQQQQYPIVALAPQQPMPSGYVYSTHAPEFWFNPLHSLEPQLTSISYPSDPGETSTRETSISIRG